MKISINKSSFLRLFSFMKGKKFFYFTSLIILSLLGMGVQIILATLFRDMFNAIEISDLSKLLELIKDYGIILLIFFFISPIFRYITRSIAADTTGNLRNKVFTNTYNLPINYFESDHSGNLISRMTNDIAEMKKAYSEIFINFTIRIITGIGTTLYMFFLEWRLALFAVIAAVLIAIINTYYSKILKKISKEVQERLANLTENLSNILAGIKVIKAFNLYDKILNLYLKSNEEVYEKSYERVRKKSIVTAFNSFSGSMSFVGLIILGSYLVIRGEIAIGIIIAVVQLQNGVSMLVRSLGNFISEMQVSLAAADRIYEILDSEKEANKYEKNHNYPDIKEDKLAVAFKNVSFSYKADNTRKLVLDELNFSVKKNTKVALAGPSGGGKSTVFKLILNFYPPESGDIIIDGKSISEQNIVDIRNKLAYVPQDAYLFSGSIYENISYGKKEASKEEIIKAAEMANAHQFILGLEKGYETLVGERGAHLSGGQRQRIAIARAILKDAPILLLDEATSSLDSESEKMVQDALEKLMKGRTTLIIAHRLATIQDADKILVLKEGKVVERGSHQVLLYIKDGVYRNLYNKQFVKN